MHLVKSTFVALVAGFFASAGGMALKACGCKVSAAGFALSSCGFAGCFTVSAMASGCELAAALRALVASLRAQ